MVTTKGYPSMHLNAFGQDVELRLVDASRNRFRVYGLTVCRTLFGELCLRVVWGRMGHRRLHERSETFADAGVLERRRVELLARRRRHGYVPLGGTRRRVICARTCGPGERSSSISRTSRCSPRCTWQPPRSREAGLGVGAGPYRGFAAAGGQGHVRELAGDNEPAGHREGDRLGGRGDRCVWTFGCPNVRLRADDGALFRRRAGALGARRPAGWAAPAGGHR
jgi:predicted DNA-binding WGR domain protein